MNSEQAEFVCCEKKWRRLRVIERKWPPRQSIANTKNLYLPSKKFHSRKDTIRKVLEKLLKYKNMLAMRSRSIKKCVKQVQPLTYISNSRCTMHNIFRLYFSSSAAKRFIVVHESFVAKYLTKWKNSFIFLYIQIYYFDLIFFPSVSYNCMNWLKM